MTDIIFEDTIGRLWGGVIQDDALPEEGYSTKFRELKKKRLIICGMEPWVHYPKQANDPYDASKTIEEVFPKTKEMMSGEIDKVGKVFCRNGVFGVTHQKLDLITFCDDVFAMGDYKSAVHNVDEITTGHNIDESGVATRSMARVMLHEFAHYHGTKVPANNNEELSDADKLSDKDAIDKNGCVVYWQPKTRKFVRDDNDEFNPGQKLKSAKVYT